MTARDFFFLEGRRLRAPWRLALFLLTLVACAPLGRAVYAVALGPLATAARLPAEAALWWSVVLTLAAAHLIALRWIDRTGWADVWLDRRAARPAALLSGTAIGALAIGLPTLLLLGTGWLAVRTGGPGSWAWAALASAMILIPAAMAEELLFRGYPFRVLWDGIGWPAAVALTSATFALLHLNNPGAGPRPLLLVGLAGVMLGMLVVVTRSLWAAWAAHFAWNFVLAAVFHSAVSGGGLPTPGYVTVDAGPDWATGGSWGPEGGAVAGLGMLAGLGWILRGWRRGGVAATVASHPDSHHVTRPAGREEPHA